MEYAKYFEYRKVSSNDYQSFVLPAYLKKKILEIDNPRILDFGCGFGQMLRALRAVGVAGVEGIDIEPAAIDFCRSEGFLCADGLREPDFYLRRSGHYDFVLLSHVLEHFPKRQMIRRLEQIRQLLKPGGGLLVVVPNAQSNTGPYWAYEDFTHHTLFTSGSLHYVLQASGYTQVEFLDVDCTEGLSPLKRMIKRALLRLYQYRYEFWNRVTSSSTHAASRLIFSYEIKALARS